MVHVRATADQWVAGLAELSGQAAEQVGGKAANLARMRTTGHAVPDGFCVAAEAYRDALADDPRMRAVVDELDLVTAEEPVRLAGLAERARAVVLDAGLPQRLRADIVASYHRLGDVPVAVRSSATAEDLPHASFAGLQDTYLGVTGADEVVLAVRRCWASLWTERAVSYRVTNGIDHRTVAIAVVVQVMLDATVSGVLFTANPVTGNRAELVVDAAPGLGEAVVSGSVVTDHYLLPADGAAAEQEHGCLDAARLAELRDIGAMLLCRVKPLTRRVRVHGVRLPGCGRSGGWCSA
ncbi:MAG: hypothetical protein GEV07_21300 [Streptosporangiales bacterium]|nr:hypothetical protein [Streptosporangiales bacterium]